MTDPQTRPLLPALHSAEASYQAQRLSSTAEREILAALAQAESNATHRQARSHAWAVALAGIALAAAALLGLRLRDLDATRATKPAPDVVLGFRSDQPCLASVPAGGVETSGECRLEPVTQPGVHIVAAPRTLLNHDRAGITLVRGRATFHVDPILPGQPPVRILISGGTIEVIGTRFDVVEEEREGAVTLVSGRIVFTDRQDRRYTLRPGERYSWRGKAEVSQSAPPPPPKAAQSPAKPAPAPAPSTASPSHPSELSSGDLEELIRLRETARYDDAARVLKEKLEHAQSAREAEVVGFELGDVLSKSGGNSARVCEYWADYLRRFPSGRYRADAEQNRNRLGCP